jgi:hypothetical protein
MGEVASRSGGAGGTVPAMPVIRSSERFIGRPYPLLDGLTPVIGWQGRPDAQGGFAFVVMSRGVFGPYKVVERFPLSEQGWAEAWQALVKLSPAAAGKIQATLRGRIAEDRAWQRGWSRPLKSPSLTPGLLPACMRSHSWAGTPSSPS